MAECQLVLSGKESTLCSEADRPAHYEKCDMGECPRWDYGAWSECERGTVFNEENERACGVPGVRRRLVVCRNATDGTVLDDGKCNHQHRAVTKPADSEPCVTRQCVSWITGNWSNCELNSCTVIRLVRCGFSNGTFLADAECKATAKPAYLAECERHADCDRHMIKKLVFTYHSSTSHKPTKTTKKITITTTTTTTSTTVSYILKEKWSKVNLYIDYSTDSLNFN